MFHEVWKEKGGNKKGRGCRTVGGLFPDHFEYEKIVNRELDNCSGIIVTGITEREEVNIMNERREVGVSVCGCM